MKWKELLIHYKKIIIYYIIGIINTLVDFAVYSGVFFLTHMPVPSQATGYVSGILCSFCLNRGITFRAEKGGSPLLQFVRFILVNLVSLGISLGSIHLLTDCLGINGYLAKIPISFVTSLINYFGYKFLVFKREEEDPCDTENVDTHDA